MELLEKLRQILSEKQISMFYDEAYKKGIDVKKIDTSIPIIYSSKYKIVTCFLKNRKFVELYVG